MDIDITGLDKAAVLHALYNGSHVQGMGFLQARSNYTLEDAKADLEQSKQWGSYFDYLHGRVLKVSLKGDTFSAGLYDRDCGQGAALAALRSAGLDAKAID